MPKINWKKKIAGVLGKQPHPYHRHWQFMYSEDASGLQASLDNSDLEECPYKRQIKMVHASVILYIGEEDTNVDVDLYLPSKVTMVVIKKFGKGIFCFVTVGGSTTCSVYPGCNFKLAKYLK